MNNLQLKPGIFNLTWNQYRVLPALNNSALDHLARSPLHYKTYLEQPQEPPTPAIKVGSAFHFAVLQPDRFRNEIVQDPGWNKNSKKYKDWAAGQEGKIVLKKDDIQHVKAMRTMVKTKRSAMEYLSEGWPEKAIIWQDPETGVWCKGLIDWLTPDLTVVDLKKTQVATRWAFGGSIRRYRYNRQAAFYRRGMAALGMIMKDFVWIAAEEQTPHDCQVFVADSEEMDREDTEITPLLQLLAHCLETDEWPGYPDEPVYFGYQYQALEGEDIEF